MKNLIYLIIGGALLLTGCDGNSGGVKIAGSGKTGVEQRSAANFKRIKAGGAMELQIAAGGTFALEIEADDNLLPKIKTEVRGDTLHIETEGEFTGGNKQIARVTLPELTELDLSGASKAVINNVKTARLELNAKGASQITINGETANLDADLSGASQLDAVDLRAQNVKVSASGASRAAVFAAQSILAKAGGASNIVYAGDPQTINKDASGASTITNK